MALPPRMAAVYVLLSQNDTTPTTPRTNGTVIESYVNIPYDPAQPLTWQRPPTQPSFYGSQQWYKNYPDDCVAKVHLGLINSGNFWPDRYLPFVGSIGNRIYVAPFTNNMEIDATYPANIVESYNPTPFPGPADPVPDPNGTVGTNTPTVTSGSGLGQFYLPRWYTDTAYDVGNDQFGIGSITPEFDTEYYINENGFFGSFSPYYQQVGPWSVDLTVDNYQSEVFNEQTSTNEYYDFTQPTFDYKQTTTVKVFLSALGGNICCWNKGTIINGTVSFQSIAVETTALGRTATVNPDPSYNYNFAGMIAKTATSASPSGTASFTVTIDSAYVPVEIEVPTMTGCITFVNDFRIDSVTPPA